jgi:hypothetical protein
MRAILDIFSGTSGASSARLLNSTNAARLHDMVKLGLPSPAVRRRASSQIFAIKPLPARDETH